MAVYFFLLNLVSNLSYCIYNSSLRAIMYMIGLAALTACVESFIVMVWKNSAWKMTMMILFSLIHVILVIVDYFLIFQFRMICNQDIINILSETNPEQTNDFLQSYISLPSILAILCSISLLIIVALFLNRWGKKLVVKYVIRTFAVVGIMALLISGYGFLRYGDGYSIPQFSAPTRVAWSLKILTQRQKSISKLNFVCQRVTGTCDLTNAPTIIVVIGESFSVYHCSLYGYEKETFPLLGQRVKRGNLFVMNDVVCIADATHRNMKAIFSLGNGDSDFDTKPLFPAVFKNVGYKTAMYDNQYFLGHGVTFLTDRELSTKLFDERNEHGYVYDGDMLDDIQKLEVPALYVFHLWGQHYTYANRYPKSFHKFKEDDYGRIEHADVIAQYDNANLYNDHVLNEIIKKFESDDALLVYFSDHGEEVYEQGFMGHGTSMSQKDFRYQLRVPMFIWMSDTFLERRGDVARKVKEREDEPLMTCDISHFLLDVAGIETDDFDATRSLINSRFSDSRPRLVMENWNYDKHLEDLK